MEDLQAHFKLFPPKFALPVFLDNHDTDRIMLSCGQCFQLVLHVSAVRFTFVFLLNQQILRGVAKDFHQPYILYAGTEVGVTHFATIRSEVTTTLTALLI